MPVPIFRISMSNATVLSVAYLAVAMLVEGLRRWFSFRWTEPVAEQLAFIPERTLHLLGLYAPLRAAAIDDRLSVFQVRLVLGATSVVVIFAVSLAVAGLMWVGRWAIARVDRRSRQA